MRREKEGRRRRRIGYWRLSRYFSSRVDPFILTLDITVFRGANRGQNRLTWNRVAVHRNPFSTRFNKYWRSRIEICMDGEIGKIFLLVKERFPDKQRGPSPVYSGRNGNPTMTRSDDVDDVCLGGISLVASTQNWTLKFNIIRSIDLNTFSSSFLLDNRVTGENRNKIRLIRDEDTETLLFRDPWYWYSLYFETISLVLIINIDLFFISINHD